MSILTGIGTAVAFIVGGLVTGVLVLAFIGYITKK